MPRAKRPLAEADPNASRAPTDAKRNKPTPAKNTLDGYESRSKEELGTMLKERSLPHTGTKKVLIQRLEESRNVQGPPKKGDHSTISSDNNSRTLPRRRSGRFTGSSNEPRLGAVDVRPTKTERPEDGSRSSKINKTAMNYLNKDNSKLRTLLYDRGLSVSGAREEMITRLQNTYPDYERLTSAEISEMLRRRHVSMSDSGSKETKLKRLMLNDELDFDTGNSEESVLYSRLAVSEDIERSILTDMEDVDNKYSSWDLDRLIANLKDRKLPATGEKLDLVRRLKGHDRMGLAKIKEAKIVQVPVRSLGLNNHYA